MNENGKNLSQDISEIKDEIQKSLQNSKYIKDIYDKERDNDLNDINYDSFKMNKNTQLHVTYFIPVLQFLDIKSLIELSKVNHLFYSFIYSFYFYRSVNQVIKYSNKYNKIKKDDIFSKNNMKKIKPNNTENSHTQNSENDDGLIFGPTKKIYSSFMSALTGAFSYINPVSETSNVHKEKNEKKEIEKKIILHEKLIDERIKLLAISNKIKATKAEIDKYIKEKYNIKNRMKNNSGKINDQTIKKLKREKYESEYRTLMKEINEYEKQYDDLKKENEIQSNKGIDLETKINKIKYYAKNFFNNQ
jgi:hypothetical protein